MVLSPPQDKTSSHLDKLPLLGSAVNTNIKHKYVINPPVQNYLMETHVTPELRQIHCEQKAYKQLGYFFSHLLLSDDALAQRH